VSRVRILVEGQTEETFVNDVLSPHLNNFGVYPYAFLFRKKGGSFAYQRVQREILNTLKEKSAVVCTTMVDYYAMPNDWPGRVESQSCRNYRDKAAKVEQALLRDITSQRGDSWNPASFIPYVQMHEFETLLFSGIDSWIEGNISELLKAAKKSFSCPEEINDNEKTSPSHRIIDVFEKYGQKYNKIVDGVFATRKIGLKTMRKECPHFNEWITKLENLGNT
jgi:hypothetical protein